MTDVVPLRGLAGTPDLAGDHLNAQIFLDRHGDQVRRAPELGHWFFWNKAWWEPNRLQQVEEMAAGTIDYLRSWAAEADTPDEYKRRAAHYTKSTTASRRNSLLEIAGTDRNIVVATEELDTHPLLLACLNGTVDLRTRGLKDADPADLITHGIRVEYDPDANPQEWLRFLNIIFSGDAELIAYVQRLLGYCLTGSVDEHVMPVLHGLGRNGKSTLTGVVQDLLGDLAISAPDGLVIRHDHEPHPERIAALRGKRMVVSNELEAQAVLAEQTIKMLTGGASRGWSGAPRTGLTSPGRNVRSPAAPQHSQRQAPDPGPSGRG